MEIEDFDDDLVEEHRDWHMPGTSRSRKKSPGNWPAPTATNPNGVQGREEGAGKEFLGFHRYFLWKVYDWFQKDKGSIPSSINRWGVIPAVVKNQDVRYLDLGPWRYDGIEQQLISNNPSIGTDEEFGNLIEFPFPGLHGWIHPAGGQAYNDELFTNVMTSPKSTLFYNWHGLINLWWKQWALPTMRTPIAGQVILFEHEDFRGPHKHIITDETNLNESNDNFFNDRVSSIAVISGSWQFFRDPGFQNPYFYTLGRGLYPNTRIAGIVDNTVSSLRPASGQPDLQYGSMLGHVILFEHVNCRGRHKHVLAPEPFLNAANDNFFDDRVSSLVVVNGRWAFFRDPRWGDQFPPILGPGMYDAVSRFSIQNDSMSSLLPVVERATRKGQKIDGQVLLFEDRDFLGEHKHVFNAEPNLDSSDDKYFNDRTSSIAVISGWWTFFRDSNYADPDPTLLGPGLTKYQFVEDVGIQNDRISSLLLSRQVSSPSGFGTPQNVQFDL